MGMSLVAATDIAGALAPPAGSPVGWAWLLPVVPALSAALLLLFGKRLGRSSGWVGVLAAGFTATLAIWIFAFLAGQPAGARVFTHSLGTWISAGPLEVTWSLLVDPLSSVMLLLVTCVGLLIHVYSLGYMRGDDRYPTFFAYMNLFLASMLVLVLGDSLLTLFVGWELVGLCSYLLIGFWFERRDYASAAKKAFVVNRVGDVGFMIAMFVAFSAFGSLAFADVLPQAGTVASGTLVVIALLLFVGATGKSAQIPLHVWLPDAMAGPTPVSALIHAATMVTAGVYLVARMSPLYAAADLGLLIAWVGVATALYAALVACAQRDIKRILAYSTVSQLGYMFVGVGVGEYTAGIFHLLTHGFFKALLFLAAGSVMHALANETDVFRMGGLWRAMPVTALTSAVGVLAIAGFPGLSGFFSKEEILAAAADTPGGVPIWFVGVVVAALTAFYMGRWFVLVFLGPRRWERELPGVHPHESPLSMTLPLVLLAVASAFGGLLNTPGTHWLGSWLEPSIVAFTPGAEFLTHGALMVVAVAAGLVGLALAWARYLRTGVEVGAAPARYPNAYRWASDAFYVDRLYERVIAQPGKRFADVLAAFDANVVDGAVNGVATLTRRAGDVGRRIQTGFVRSYALAVLAGAVLLVLVLFAPTIVRVVGS
jgi:NADH-quinone oxidoreductase subunit L